MKKAIAIILTITLSAICIVGCNNVNTSEDYDENATDIAFTLISSGSRFSVYKEDITDVMYVAYNAGYRGGLTVMLDTDGTPLLYSEWKEQMN